MKIRARSPVRISFAGGGTDIYPFMKEYGGAVLNATINRYAWTTLETDTIEGIEIISDDFSKKIFAPNKKELGTEGELQLIKLIVQKMDHVDGNIRVSLKSEVPPSSGLGGSGSAFASVIGAFNHLLNEKSMTSYEIAELAHDLERNDMRIPGGCQDQYATVFGGINFMEFEAHNKVKISPLKLPKSTIYELEKRLLLVHIGDRTSKSVNIILDQVKSYNNIDQIENLKKMKEMTYTMKRQLLSGDIDSFGKSLHEAWIDKKKFSKYITNPQIDELYEEALAHGAIGGKITGAGGGGHMLFLCEENSEHKVAEALIKKGCTPIKFSFDFEGLQTWEVKDTTKR
jgi:D-glycero-alpha-D-manno-heptose-7-phosphate kinase